MNTPVKVYQMPHRISPSCALVSFSHESTRRESPGPVQPKQNNHLDFADISQHQISLREDSPDVGSCDEIADSSRTYTFTNLVAWTLFALLLIVSSKPTLAASSPLTASLREMSDAGTLERELRLSQVRLNSDSFTSDRVFKSGSGSFKPSLTTCQNLLDENFEHYLDGLPAKARVLDLGAGNGSIVHSWLAPKNNPQVPIGSVEELTKPGPSLAVDKSKAVSRIHFWASIYSTLLAEQFYYQDYEQVISGPFHSANFPIPFAASFDLYGAFAYSQRPDQLIANVLSSLAPSGRYDFVYDRYLVLSRNSLYPKVAQGTIRLPPIKTNFKVVDSQGRDRTTDWFLHIKGASYRAANLHPSGSQLVKEWIQEIKSHATVILKAEDFEFARDNSGRSYLSIQQGVFIRTLNEEINIWQAGIFERNSDAIFVPPLQLIDYIDGRPPHRVFHWDIQN